MICINKFKRTSFELQKINRKFFIRNSANNTFLVLTYIFKSFLSIFYASVTKHFVISFIDYWSGSLLTKGFTWYKQNLISYSFLSEIVEKSFNVISLADLILSTLYEALISLCSFRTIVNLFQVLKLFQTYSTDLEIYLDSMLSSFFAMIWVFCSLFMVDFLVDIKIDEVIDFLPQKLLI